MKVRAVLAVLVAFCASAAAQTATGIHLVDVRFRGQTQIKDVDLRKCAAELESKDYEGPDWLDGVAEYVRRRCLQDNGYFKAIVLTPTAEQLPDRDATHQFIVTFSIDPGKQYRLGELVFRGNPVLSVTDLRSMFKLRPGEIFRMSSIREGINEMHSAYQQRGYPNFTAVPDLRINDSTGIISVDVYCDTGKQVSSRPNSR